MFFATDNYVMDILLFSIFVGGWCFVSKVLTVKLDN